MSIGISIIMMIINSEILKSLKQNFHIFQMTLAKNYLKKYLVIHL